MLALESFFAYYGYMPKLLYASGRDSTMFYQVRMPIPDPFFFLDCGDVKYIFLDSREYGAFEEFNQNAHIKPIPLEPLFDAVKAIPGSGPGAGKLALAILQTYGLTQEPIHVDAHFPVYMADYLRAHNCTLIPQTSLYPERIIKTKAEVNALKSSLAATTSAFARIEEILRESSIDSDTVVWQGATLTSEILKIEVEKVLLERDMMNVEGIIIASGSQAAIPHHRGSGAIVPHQTIVCDIFPQNRTTGFFADMTRTYVKGVPSPEAQKMFEAVLDVQTHAIAAVKPGVSFGKLHKDAVSRFVELGYTPGSEGFTHALGHGLGLDVHELPFTRDTENLQPGHVITIEPGLYYKNFGGVRIEDVVLVTETRCTVLSQHPNIWSIL